jgi:hypothetical protein
MVAYLSLIHKSIVALCISRISDENPTLIGYIISFNMIQVVLNVINLTVTRYIVYS